MSKYVIGVDIGGTKIATGAITLTGKLKHKVVLPTLSEKGFDVSIEQVYRSIYDVLEIGKISKNMVEGIGVCAPGPLDPDRGVVHNPPNLKGWKEVPLASLIRKKFKKKTRLENDANAAGVAELIWGAAKGYKYVFYVTISTGIGTAVIIDGKLYHGKNGMAGEGGHVTVNYDDTGAKCGCGNTGCIETLASGLNVVKRLVRTLKEDPSIKTSLIDMVEGELDKITMVTVGDAAQAGDKLALEVIAEEGKLLGIWFGSMINILDPEIIVIGGGVSFLGGFLFRHIKKTIPLHTINIYAKKIPIVQAKLKRDVGIYGAASALLARDRVI